ncbi:MAG: hypothetical protein NVS3B27_06910 [Novosphingobium sp.]
MAGNAQDFVVLDGTGAARWAPTARRLSMRSRPYASTQTGTRPGDDRHKWLKFGLLIASCAGILAVVTWVESGLVG